MTAENQITLDVRNTFGIHLGDEPSDASPSAIAITCDRIRVAVPAAVMVTVPGLGIVKLNRDATDERHFMWIEDFDRDADGPEGPAFVVGDMLALRDALATS